VCSPTAQSDGRNQNCGGPIIDANSVTPWLRLPVLLPDTLPAAWSISSEDQQAAFASVPRLPGHPKWKCRCTRIRRDERGWHDCAAIGSDQSESRFSLQLHYPFLSASICVSLFLPRRHTRAGLAAGTPGRETAPPNSRGAVRSLSWSGRLGAMASGAGTERDVGGPLALTGRPVVVHREGLEHRGVSRVEAARDPVQQIGPHGLHLAVHQRSPPRFDRAAVPGNHRSGVVAVRGTSRGAYPHRPALCEHVQGGMDDEVRFKVVRRMIRGGRQGIRPNMAANLSWSRRLCAGRRQQAGEAGAGRKFGDQALYQAHGSGTHRVSSAQTTVAGAYSRLAGINVLGLDSHDAKPRHPRPCARRCEFVVRNRDAGRDPRPVQIMVVRRHPRRHRGERVSVPPVPSVRPMEGCHRHRRGAPRIISVHLRSCGRWQRCLFSHYGVSSVYGQNARGTSGVACGQSATLDG